MKKKLLTSFTGMVLLLGSLVGCGSTEEATSEFVLPEGGYDGSAITITFYHAMGQDLQDILNKYITKFNQIYPNITVDAKYIGNYEAVLDQISTELAVKKGPNLAYCYPDHIAKYMKSKRMVALDTFMDDTNTYTVTNANGEEVEYTIGLSEEERADFVSQYYDEGKIFDDAGTMYSLPYAKSTEVMYYNKDFFDANNLTVPTTWDEMWEVCKQIKKINPESIPLGYDSSSNWFITMCEQMGSGYTSSDSSNHFLFNNDTNKKWLRDLKEKYEAGLFTTRKLYGSYTSSLFTNTESNKVCYMCIGSSAGASYQSPEADSEGELPFTGAVTAIPQYNLDNPKAIQQGPAICMFSDSNDQKMVASWLFLKYLTTNQQLQAENSVSNGYTPVLKSTTNLTAYSAWLDSSSSLQAASTKVCIANRDSNFISPAFVGSSTARDQVGALLETVVSGTKDIDTAFDDAIAECEYFS
jgi:multiple sugar transport system substrate-binding protein